MTGEVVIKVTGEKTLVVSMRGILKRFGGILAVNKVNFEIYPSIVHVILLKSRKEN